MSPRTLPPTASVTETATGDRLVMPAAARNIGPISDLLADAIDGREVRRALEIASGTGQHVLHHARRHPGITWQPTDVNARHVASIDSYADDAPAGTILPALLMDATRPGWSGDVPPQDLIVVVNLLHLISMEETATLIREVGQALAPGGTFVIYGPFMRGGELTSEGDARFHAELVGADPQIGYKDDFDIVDLLHASGMELSDLVDMPANNLAFVARTF